jgi:hypothetical protein
MAAGFWQLAAGCWLLAVGIFLATDSQIALLPQVPGCWHSFDHRFTDCFIAASSWLLAFF